MDYMDRIGSDKTQRQGDATQDVVAAFSTQRIRRQDTKTQTFTDANRTKGDCRRAGHDAASQDVVAVFGTQQIRR